MWQLQHGSSPRIEQNSVETCLIVFMVSGGAAPRIESNTVTCAALSLGLVMDQSAGNIYNNTFNYVTNGKYILSVILLPYISQLFVDWPKAFKHTYSKTSY